MKNWTIGRSCRALGVPLAAVSLLLYASAGQAQVGYAALVRSAAPSVVTILVEQKSKDAGQRVAERVASQSDEDPAREIIRRLLSGPGAQQENIDGGSVLGSGFIIRDDGLIVTNRHVVFGARSVRVRLADAREVPAEVIGSDSATDLALLKVNAGHLPVLRLGSSDKVAVGDAVIAIGNPFGLGQTVTAGIISARGRTLEADPYIDFLQTDAAINHGNSGGPLLSMDGTVVGVTSVIFSPTGASVGLGFAIPAETVVSVARDIEAHGHVDRGYLGVSAQPMTAGLAAAFGMKNTDGALIAEVAPDGPSASVLRAGDVLLRVGDVPASFTGLGKTTARLAPDSSVRLAVFRGGEEVALDVKVGRLPDPPADPNLNGTADTWNRSLALAFASTTADMRKALKAELETTGLIITQVRRDGPAAVAGLAVGDLLTHAGTKRLTDVTDLALISRPTAELPLLLRVVRSGSARFVAVTGSEDP